MQLIATWLAGPDSGGRHEIAAGATVIGTTGLRCDDPGLLAHHALLEVSADGPWITQLAGSTPITVAGRPPLGRSPVEVGAPIRIATSTLVLSHEPPTTAIAPRHPASTRRIVRVPRLRPPGVDELTGDRDWDPATNIGDAPDPPERERPGGLVPMFVGLAGSAVLAVAAHRPMLIAFGALGAAVACSSWVGQWFAFRRRHRRELAAHSARLARHLDQRRACETQFIAALRHAAPGVSNALRLAATPDDGLWARRSSHHDAFTVSVGVVITGTVPTGDAGASAVAAGIEPRHSTRPTPIDLGAHTRVAVCGPHAPHVARAILVQLATQCGPADVRVVVATRAPHDWRWLAELPHVRGEDGPLITQPERVHDAIESVAHGQSHLVVVTDDHEALAERTSMLRHVLDSTGVAHALLAVLPHSHEPPQLCTAVLLTDHVGFATWRHGPSGGVSSPTLITGVGMAAAARVAAALGQCTDPEDVLGAVASLPATIDMDELLDPDHRLTARSIATHWTTGADRHDPALCTPLGTALTGPITIDLVRDGPHALVAGTTGSGKSELLRSMIIGLATTCSPQHLSLVLVDYKGGATFDALAPLPHVSGVVTDLDDHLADRMLRSLQAELRRREELLRAAGATDITTYRNVPDRSAGTHQTMPRLVVVIDEFAALAAERPSFLHALIGIAQRGRSLGVHLVLATQRPGGMVGDDIRANTTLRIALRLHETADAIDVVGDRLPTTLPRARPGRAVVRVGGDEPIIVQTARCADIERAVARLVDAHVVAGLELPTRPWLPPLPAVLLDRDLEADALGVLDDPDRQCRLPLRHTAGEGALIVVGSRGAGVTSTLLSIVVRRRNERPHDAIHVIDANGDQRWSALAAHRTAHVTAADGDDLVRLVHRLRTRPIHSTTVIVDGIDELRVRLDTPAHDHRLEHRHETRLEQLVAALITLIGTGADVILGAANPALLPGELLGRSARRWVLHLDDPQRAAVLGMPASLVPAAVAGRVRVDALLGQITPPPLLDNKGCTPVSQPQWWLDALPAVVPASSLQAPHRLERRTDLTIGLDVIGGSEVRITIDDGEHLMVLGPRGSGRTAALTMLGTLLHAAAPVIVDDAERVNDADGALARAVDVGRVSVVTAARGDALRQRLGHWTTGVRRSRLALVLVGGAGDATTDGELVGAALPRRFPVTVRPGSAWLIDGTALVPVRLAFEPCRGSDAVRIATVPAVDHR